MGWKLLFFGCNSRGENVFLFSWDINDEMILSDFTFLKVKPQNSELVEDKCNPDFPSVTWMEEAACVRASQSWSASYPALLFYWAELLSRMSTCFILVISWRRGIATYFHCQDKSLHVKFLPWLITAGRCNSRHVTHWSLCPIKLLFPFYYIFSIFGGAVDNLISYL